MRYNLLVKDCPKAIHFHVACIDVMEEKDFNLVIEVSDPNDALSQTIKDLPDNWEGSIEVNDHRTMASNHMPLIDFWRTPIRQ